MVVNGDMTVHNDPQLIIVGNGQWLIKLQRNQWWLVMLNDGYKRSVAAHNG